MNREGLETEKKYDVGPGAALPALQDISGVGRVGEPSEAVLEAVYFDTADLALAARRITLRRRTGGTDAGWHLKLAPEGNQSSQGGGDSVPQRQEIHAPLGQADVVPDQLLVHLHAYLRGAAVSPAARLKNRRTTHPLYGHDGVHLADFADDRVESEALGSGLKQEWREWELELVRGSAEIFPSAETCFTAAGARPAAHESKLGRALGEAWPEQPDAKQPDDESAGQKGPASGVVTAYLGAQIAQLLRTDPAVRLEEPDAVHQMRSATRRLRSALAVYRKLFGDAAVQRLRDELKWLGRILGAPRDAEVTRERVLAGVNALPPEQADAVRDRLERELGDRFTAGYRRVQEVLVSDRYYRLLDALEEFRDNPPALPAGAAPAGQVAGKRIGRTVRRLRRSAKAARKEKAGPAHDTALHQVRKDAKRLRHAAESVIPLHGKRATKLADAAHRQQKILGDHHDSVVARTLLGKLARGPQPSEHVRAAYVRLVQKEDKAAARTEAKYRKARRKARKLLKRGLG
ncbi:MAG: metal-chelation protein [Arthrobacter sp.]|nr:metal-chelation protein [Arthrobacter sp.]